MDFGGDQRKARVYGDAEYEFRRFTTIGPETSAALLAGYGRSRVSLPPRERRCMAAPPPTRVRIGLEATWTGGVRSVSVRFASESHAPVRSAYGAPPRRGSLR